jgi:hypothetical protein
MGHSLSAGQESALRLDTIERAAKALTRSQLAGLRRIRDGGPGEWCGGRGRAGGSIFRMFDQMAAAGLCTTAPHNLTAFGRKVLAERERRCRHFMVGYPQPRCIYCRKAQSEIRR